MRATAVALLACAFSLADAQGLGHLPLWPLPRSVTTGGPALVPLSPFFSFTTSSPSARLARAMARYSSIISLNEEGGPVQLEEATIAVASADESLNSSTSYAYTLSFDAAASSAVQISADTIYGAMYAMVSRPCCRTVSRPRPCSSLSGCTCQPARPCHTARSSTEGWSPAPSQRHAQTLPALLRSATGSRPLALPPAPPPAASRRRFRKWSTARATRLLPP